MKKIIITLLTLILLFGCEKLFKQKENTIVIWETYNTEEHRVFVEIVNDFLKIYNKDKKPGDTISISVQRVPFDGLLNKIITACLAKRTPDICRVAIEHVPRLAFGQALEPLDKYGAWDLKDKFVQAPYNSNVVLTKNLETNKIEKHIFGLPDQTTGVALFYNKQLFRESAEELKAKGLDPNRAPKTWDEFIEYGKILTKDDMVPKQYGFAMDASLWFTFPFFSSWGAEFVVKDKKTGKYKCVINSKEGIEALAFKKALYSIHKIEAGNWKPGSVGKEVGFINGNYAMIFTGPWNVSRFQSVDFGISLLPAGPKGPKTNLGGTNMVIMKDSLMKQESYDFLVYLTGIEAQKKWCEKLGQIPVNKNARKVIDTSMNPWLEIFMKQMDYSVAPPKVPRADLLMIIMDEEMYSALAEEEKNKENEHKTKKELIHETIKKALDKAAERINREVLTEMNE